MADRVLGFIASAIAHATNAVKSGTAIVVDRAVPALLIGTAAVVNYTANTAVPAIRNGTVSHALGSGAREVITAAGYAVVGVAAVSFVGVIALQCMGFTSVGPAAGSFAASWMSSIATSSGRVVAGSLYSLLQAAAMGGGFLIRSPKLLAVGAIAGGLVWVGFKF